MSTVRKELVDRTDDQVLYDPYVLDTGAITAEINGVHNPVRGEFLIVSFFLREYSVRRSVTATDTT